MTIRRLLQTALTRWGCTAKSALSAWRDVRTSRREHGRLTLECLETRDCPTAGTLDATFGGTGTVTLPRATAYTLDATVVQADGKVVGVGSVSVSGVQKIAVVRLNRDGSPDATFNGSGSAVLPLDNAGGSAVALQLDGKIVIGGTARVAVKNVLSDEYVVARLNANGSLDTTFASSRKSGGVFAYNPSTTYGEEVSNVAVLPNGSIIVGGQAETYGNTSGSFSALKLTSAGILDTSFGSGGRAVVHVGSSGTVDTMHGMAIVPGTNQIVLCGAVSGTADANGTAALAMLTASGQPDSSFNGTGTLLAPLAGMSGSEYNAVAVQGSAALGYKIVTVGSAFSPTSTGSTYVCELAARYNLSGSLDTTFGTAGGYSVIDNHYGLGFTALALAADGSLVVGGRTVIYDPATGVWTRQMFVGRLSADGLLDTSFGSDGTGFVYTTAGATGELRDLAIDPLDGGIVACGMGGDNLNQGAFARFTAR